MLPTVISVAVGALIQWQTASKAAARLQGANEQRWAAQEKTNQELKNVNDQQWREINDNGKELAAHAAQIAVHEERWKFSGGKAKGAHA